APRRSGWPSGKDGCERRPLADGFPAAPTASRRPDREPAAGPGAGGRTGSRRPDREPAAGPLADGRTAGRRPRPRACDPTAALRGSPPVVDLGADPLVVDGLDGAELRVGEGWQPCGGRVLARLLWAARPGDDGAHARL